MTWYYIVLMSLAYLIIGSVVTGLFKKSNKKHGRSCYEDEYVFMFIFWPLVAIAKVCILIINSIGDSKGYCKH